MDTTVNQPTIAMAIASRKALISMLSPEALPSPELDLGPFVPSS